MSIFSPQPTSHDDLAALFNRTLSLNPILATQLGTSTTNPSMPIYTSSHYTPSTSATTSSTTAPAAPARHHMSNDAKLRAHGINPNSLSPSQIALFRIASDDQQRRLLDLWKIFPVSLPGEDPSHAWTPTTVETEEHRAIARFAQIVGKQQVAEVQTQAQIQQSADAMEDDTMTEEVPQDFNPALPVRHNTSYGWINTDEDPFSEDSCGGSCAPEPYMMSGYEQLMARDAVILREREQEKRRMERAEEIVRQKQQEEERWLSQGSFEGAYSHFGSAVGGGRVQYRPAAFDRIYDNTLVECGSIGQAINVSGDCEMEM